MQASTAHKGSPTSPIQVKMDGASSEELKNEDQMSGKELQVEVEKGHQADDQAPQKEAEANNDTKEVGATADEQEAQGSEDIQTEDNKERKTFSLRIRDDLPRKPWHWALTTEHEGLPRTLELGQALWRENILLAQGGAARARGNGITGRGKETQEHGREAPGKAPRRRVIRYKAHLQERITVPELEEKIEIMRAFCGEDHPLVIQYESHLNRVRDSPEEYSYVTFETRIGRFYE